MTQVFPTLLAMACGHTARFFLGMASELAGANGNELLFSGRRFFVDPLRQCLLEDLPMDATDIMQEMHQKYAECSSYQDSGFVRLPLLSFGAELRFKTYFVRPNKFRLDWQHYKGTVNNSSGSIWTDGDRVYARLAKGKEEKESLRQAIANSAELSAGTSTAVPTLLIPFADKYVLTDLKKVCLVSDDTNPACFCIRGWSQQDDDTQLWIDKETLVLKRMRAGIGQKTKQPFDFIVNLLARSYGVPVDLASIIDTTMQQHCREDRVYEDITFDQAIAEDVFSGLGTT
jgi:hypothetical protein